MAVSMQKALNYVKNVGSSFGYAAIDMIKSNDLGDSVIDNLSTVKDLYTEIKDFKSAPMDRVKSNQKIMSYSNDLKAGIENLKSDIKSGQWYNKSRSDDAMSKLMGFDFDFEDFDFDFDMDEEDTRANVAATLEGTEKEILAMDIVGSKVSAAVGSATAKSAEYIVGANAESTRSLMNQNNKIFNVLSTGMVGVNKTLGEIAKISQPLTLHMQNAATFYTKSTENQIKMISLLEKIEANTRKPEPKKSASKKEVLGMEDYFDAHGILSISALLDNAKKNGKEAFEDSTLGMLFSMNDMMGEGTITKMFASNPIGMIATMAIPNIIITDELRKSLGKFSKALSAASNKALRDLNKYKNSWDHPVLGFISSLFGFSEGKGEKSAKPGDYEKGAVSFDGYTKQAITKVIPEYLSMILAAIDGQPQKLYNYEGGKFTNRSEIKEKVKKDQERQANSASYDFKTAATEAREKNIKSKSPLSKLSKAERNKISSLIDKYTANAIKTNNLIIGPGQVIDPKDFKKYGFKDEQELSDFLTIVSEVEGNADYWPELELLNYNIHAARIRNEKSSYGQLDTEMYLYDGSEYEYSNSINSTIANLRSMGGGRRKRTKGGKATGGTKSEAAAGAAGEHAAEETSRVISKWTVEQMMRDEGISEDSVIFDKISKKAEELERKDKLTDKEIDDFEDMLDKALKAKDSKAAKGYDNVKGFMGKLRNFIGAPLDTVRGILDKGTETLKRIMYGKEGEEDEKSILGHIFINMKQLFTDFKDWTKETIFDPIKKKIDEEGGVAKMFFKLFGIDEEKQKKLKEVKQNVKNRFKSVGKWIVDNNVFVKQYRGYKARKAGREAGENWSAYANNEPFAEGPDESGLGSGLTKFYAKKFRGGDSETQEATNTKDQDNKSGPNFVESTIGEAKNAILSFIQSIFPSKKDLDKDMQKVADVTKNAYGELKKDPSATITGALLGVGVSVLTGGIIGPFIGAALGGATGLTIGSEKVQRALFGDDVVDDKGKATGEKQGGLLGAKLSTFLSRDLSKVAKYGINGAVISLLPFIPGGPITGLMVGSAIGFANREGKLEQKLFGTMGEDGKRQDDGFISKEFQDKVKKLLPKAAVGATLGILAGPFGLVGNALVGASLGFISETERFKSAIFGKEENGERKGGITGWIREDIIKPVADALVPIAVEIKNKGTDIIRWTARSIANVFGKIVAIPVKDKLMDWFDSAQTSKGFIGAVANVVGGVVSLPFKAVGGIGRGLRQKQIRKGRANDMTAKARINYRNENGLGIDEFTDFDIALANMEEDEISNFISGYRNAKRSGDQEAIDSEVARFRTKFGLQNLNITDKNIDKYMDNLVSEKRQRKAEAAKLNPDEVRNQLIESHATKIENMLASIANHILGRDEFEIKKPGEITNSETIAVNAQTRRSTKNVVKSLFNPFTGMDMDSVREAISVYEDRLDITTLGARYNEVKQRVRKVEVNGQLRDDIIEVTDKNGYTVIVQKVNGSWMPYKWGSQLMESLKGTTVGKIVSNAVVAGKAIGNIAKTIIKTVIGNPFFGMDMNIVNRALELFFEKKDRTLSPQEKSFYELHVTELNEEYPGEDVIEVKDDKTSVVVRYDWNDNKWKSVTKAWRAKYKFKQGIKKAGAAIVKAGSKIKNVVLGVVDSIRHINPFCDFEPEEVGPIIESLNLIEFDGGSDGTGKIKRVEGLNHYYQVTSKNGTVVCVTPENSKWVYVSPKRLQAAKARNILSGIGGMVSNVARSLINGLNTHTARSQEMDQMANGVPIGAGSRARNYRGSGVWDTVKGIGGKAISGIKGLFSSGGSASSDEGGLGGLFGGSNASGGDSDSSTDALLEKINKEKFDSSKYLKLAGENAGKDLNNKEVREAERQRQSTLNIFRQSNYTEEQISKKMDVLINGLVGSGGGSGKRKGILGSILGLLTSSLGLVAGGAALGYGLYSGKLDKPLEGMYNTVAGDNTKAGSGEFSGVTITDPNTGEIVELATSKGDPVVEQDEEGNSFYVTIYGDKIPVDSKNPPQYRGTQGFGSKIKSYLLPKAILSGHKNPIVSMPRTIITKGLQKSKFSAIRRFGTSANQWIDNILYGGIKNSGEELLHKIPGVAGIEEKLATTKFGKYYLEKMNKEALSKSLKNTAERFDSLGKNGKKLYKEFIENGADNFILKHYDDLGPETLEYLTKNADDFTDVGIKTIAGKNITYSKSGAAAAGETIAKVKGAAGNALSKFGSNMKSFFKKNSVDAIEKATAAESKKGMVESIKETFEKFAKRLSKNKRAIAALGSSEAVEQCVMELGEEVAEKASKEAAEKGVEVGIKEGADFIPIGGVIFAVVCAIYEFEEGWNSAERTWKVLDPTLLERFVSAIVPAAMQLVGAIPGVFLVDSLPYDWMMGKVVDILEKAGVDLGDLSKQREEAQKYLDEANKIRVEKNPNAKEWSFDELAVASEKEGGLNARTWGERTWASTKTALNRFGTEVTEKSKKAAKAAKDFRDGLISKDEYEKQKREGEFLTEEDFLTGFGSGLINKFRGKGVRRLAKSVFRGSATGNVNTDSNNFDYESDKGLTKTELWFNRVGKPVKFSFVDPGDSIQNILNPIKAKFTEIVNTVRSNSNSLSQYAKNGDFSSIIKYNSSAKNEKGIGGISSFITFIQKIVYGAQALLTKFGNILKNIKDKVGGVWDKIATVIKDNILGLFEGIDNKLNKAKGTNKEESGGASFISQIDPSVAGRSFGGTTIGDNGCAPSVAAMLTGTSLDAAANYAQNRGYANSAGTSADYFSSILGNAGISSEYVYTGGNSATDYLASRIAGGSPTVLLGQDPYNTSKEYSPFGPGNHYVLATGMTSDGGVVVQDPESKTPNQVYDSSILNSVKLGIPTGGGSRALKRAIRRFAGGASNPSNKGFPSTVSEYNNAQKAKNPSNKGYPSTVSDYNSNKNKNLNGRDKGFPSSMEGMNAISGYSGNLSLNHQQIWTFLLRKGLSEEGAAGLMGCWEAESGNRPDRIEGDFLKSFPGFGQVSSSSEAMDNYALNILFPATEKNVKINRNAYKGSDGHYYPGFGLAQWTGPRAQNLLEYAKSKNQDWTALGTQLDFAWKELNSKYSGVLSKLKQSGDVAALTEVAYRDYEGGKKQDWLVQRQQYAAMIYSEFTGKSFSMPSYNGTDGQMYSSSSGSVNGSTSGSTTSGTNNSSSSGVGGFISLFGDLIRAKFGKIAELVGFGAPSSDTTGQNGRDKGYPSSMDGYNQGTSMTGTSMTGASLGSNGTVAADASEANNFPYYNQGSDPWGPTLYSATGNAKQTMTKSGCGPTSMAMVLQSYHKNYDPRSAADYSLANGYRTADKGTSWGFFKSLGNKEGLDVTEFSNKEQAVNNLENNIPVIASMGPGDFTTGGHYIVLSGLKDGNLLVNDPSSTKRTGQLWDVNRSLSQAKEFWAISENGVGSIGKWKMGEENPRDKGFPSSMDEFNRMHQGNGRDRGFSSSMDGFVPAGSGSGLVYNIAQDGLNTIRRKHKSSKSAFGGASGIYNLSKFSKTRKAKYYKDLRGGASLTGENDKEILIAMIKAIITLLSNVSANSDKIGDIATAINTMNSSNTQNFSTSANALKNDLGISDNDETIAQMKELLNNLAAG